jgi:Domain of unknown function (DUF4352)
MRPAAAVILLLSALMTNGVAGKPKTSHWRVLRIGTNQEFEVGPLKYLVREFTRRSALDQRIRVDYPPEGAMFLTVWYTVENTSQNPIRLRPNQFYARDSKGRRFEVSGDLQTKMAMMDWAGAEVDLIVSELSPGVRRSLLAGFIVPTDSLAPGFRLYFPAEGNKHDFIEVWPDNSVAATEIVEPRRSAR